MTTLEPAAFTEWVRARTFPASSEARNAGAERRIGAEVELLCHLQDGGIAPLEERLLPWARALAARHGWREQLSRRRVPGFDLPGGGRVTFEPGGQIEYAAAPARAPGELVADLKRVIGTLREAAADAGIVLRACGVDPDHALADAPLQLRTPRYVAMDRYFSSRGPYGARMMRQTAAVQVSLDAAAGGLRTWRLLNAVAPILTALFADSRRYAGRDTGHASYRACCWRRLDTVRTGLLAAEPCGDPAAEYAAFALRAPAIFKPGPDGEYVEFGALLAAGRITEGDADDHLSTLFPEVRPRRYLELRAMDTVAPGGLAAAVLPLDALLADRAAIHEAGEAAGSPDPERLRRAGELGLADPELARRADALLDVARRAWRRHPDRYDGDSVEEAEAWLAQRRC